MGGEGDPVRRRRECQGADAQELCRLADDRRDARASKTSGVGVRNREEERDDVVALGTAQPLRKLTRPFERRRLAESLQARHHLRPERPLRAVLRTREERVRQALHRRRPGMDVPLEQRPHEVSRRGRRCRHFGAVQLGLDVVVQDGREERRHGPLP